MRPWSFPSFFLPFSSDWTICIRNPIANDSIPIAVLSALLPKIVRRRFSTGRRRLLLAADGRVAHSSVNRAD